MSTPMVGLVNDSDERCSFGRILLFVVLQYILNNFNFADRTCKALHVHSIGLTLASHSCVYPELHIQ